MRIFLLALSICCLTTVNPQVSNFFGLGDVLLVTSVGGTGDNAVLRPCRLLTVAETPPSSLDVQIQPFATIELPRSVGAGPQSGPGSSWLQMVQQPCSLPNVDWFGQLAPAADSTSGLVSFACYGHEPGTLLSAATSAVAALVRNDGAVDTSTRFVLPRAGMLVFGAVTDNGAKVWFATEAGVFVVSVGSIGPGEPLQSPLSNVVVHHVTAQILGSGAFLLATLPATSSVVAVRKVAWPPPEGNSTLALPSSSSDALLAFNVTAGGADSLFGHAALLFRGAWASSVFVATTADNRFNVLMFDHSFDGATGSFSDVSLRRAITINSQETMRCMAVAPGASRRWRPLVLAAGARAVGAHTLHRYSASAEQNAYTDVLHEVPGVGVLPLPYTIHGVASAPLLAPFPAEASPSPATTTRATFTSTPTQSATPSQTRSLGGSLPATPSVSASRMRGAVGPLTLVVHRIGAWPAAASAGSSPAGASPSASPSRGGSSSASRTASTTAAPTAANVEVDLEVARPLFLDILDVVTGRILESIPLPTNQSVRPDVSGPAVYYRCTQSLGGMSAQMQLSQLADQFLALPCYDAEPLVELLPMRYVQPSWINSTVADEPPTRVPRAVPRVIARIGADGIADTRTLLAEPEGECAAARMSGAATSAGDRFLVTTKPLPDAPLELAGKCGLRNMPFGNSGGADVVVNPDYADLEAGAFTLWLHWSATAACAVLVSVVPPARPRPSSFASTRPPCNNADRYQHCLASSCLLASSRLVAAVSVLSETIAIADLTHGRPRVAFIRVFLSTTGLASSFDDLAEPNSSVDFELLPIYAIPIRGRVTASSYSLDRGESRWTHLVSAWSLRLCKRCCKLSRVLAAAMNATTQVVAALPCPVVFALDLDGVLALVCVLQLFYASFPVTSTFCGLSAFG